MLQAVDACGQFGVQPRRNLALLGPSLNVLLLVGFQLVDVLDGALQD